MTESNRPEDKSCERICQIGKHFNKWDNGLYTSGFINAIPVDFLIDTGSTVSIISSYMYETVFGIEPAQEVEHTNHDNNTYTSSSCIPQLHQQDYEDRLQSVNGTDLKTFGTIHVEIILGNEPYLHKFIICEISPDAILGQDFLIKHAKKIDYPSQMLRTDRSDIQCWIGGEYQMTCRVLAKETTILPSNSVTILPINIPNREKLPDLVVFEPLDQLNSMKNISMVSSIIDRNQEPQLIEVTNYNHSDITLYPNTVLGSCEPIITEQKLQVERCAAIHNAQDLTSNTMNTDLPEHLQDLFVRSSTYLNSQEKSVLKQLLTKYQNTFSKSPEDIGRTNKVKHRIDTGNAAPIRIPPRRLPIGKREIEKQEISKMLERGIIEPSNSPWCAPLVLVTKPDLSTRICVDLRGLNSVTKKDSYALPRVDDCLEALSNSKWYNQMDLHSGFWQIELHEPDREKTAFSTSQGLYQFVVMPFGATNSPSTFERLMEDVLRGLQWTECLLYMDDIIVPGSSFDECITRLEHVLERLLNANLKLKPSKCVFFQKRVKFLGHIVSEDGISTDPEKIKAVKEWPIPRNVKHVRSFLGLASYYRRFVKSFADIARPLHKLCEKGVRFCWSNDCDNAFTTLKEALTTSPILAYPTPGKPFILDTDASQLAVGAVLSQELDDSKEHVVAYMSKALSKPEQSYCVTRKELLAVVSALKHFHSYLYGQRVLLRTDNAAVSWMQNLKNPTGQTARWLQELGTYNLTIIHRPGQKHKNADALSRIPCKSCQNQQSHSETEEEENSCEQDVAQVRGVVTRSMVKSNNDTTTREHDIILDGWDHETMRKLQLQDPDIADLIIKLDKNQHPQWPEISTQSGIVKTLWRQWDRLKMINGVLHREWKENETKQYYQLVVPDSKRNEIISLYHDIPTAAHLGIDKTVEKLQQNFYWPGLKQSVAEFIQSCEACAIHKKSQAQRMPMGQFIVGEPMERVAMDILGPLPITKRGNRYVLVVADLFTKWTQAVPIPDQEAKTVARSLVNEFICKFGTPLQLYTDQIQWYKF